MDRLKLAQGLRNLPESAREDLAGREEDIQRGKTVELLRRAGKEMYENPIVNTAIGIAPGAGDIQAGYETWNSAREGDWKGAGLNAIGILPFLPAFGGILAGKSAKTADLAKLAKAEEMIAAGLPRKQVWNETGWFQAPDKQWKFEIPDYKAQFTPTPEFFTRPRGVRQETVFSHPELAQTDYGLEKIFVQRGDEPGGAFTGVEVNGQFMPSSSTIEIGTSAVKQNPSGFAFNPDQAKSINLHELQHAVQRKEGFARGGSPESVAEFLPDPQAVNDARVMEAIMRRNNIPAEEAPQAFLNLTGKDSHPLARHLLGQELLTPHEAYTNLAGEVESRLVQKRMNMTPEELQANPPWTMYDVPEERQIVRFDANGRINQ